MAMTTHGQKRKAHHQENPLAVKKQKLLTARQKLPIFTRAKDIRTSLKNSAVLVLSGETGSGKSTQVPQFLLEAGWCTKKIAITQPRRVAAISLARRVAEEMGSPLGSSSPASKVGYSVRFDDNTSPGTRIKYLTEGMLLQELLRDAELSEYSAVVVDEVHERSVNVDLILGFLKSLIYGKRKGSLRVIVMSATADVEGIAKFFASPPEPQAQIEAVPSTEKPNNAEGYGLVATCHVEGRQYPVKTHYLSEPALNVFDSAVERILHIHCKEAFPADILVFLTGQEAIQTVQKSVEDLAARLPNTVPKIQVLPLYAALPQEAQQQIFQPAPRFTRKVILSTNIAETSVTVPGVRYVIDTGKAKIKEFRPRLGLETLLIKAISRSSADQRKGRAGREAPGQCFRLYTEATYNELTQDQKPEILRCDLASALLAIKARDLTSSTTGVDDILSFPFLTPPGEEAMGRALLTLLRVDALDDKGKITSQGRKIARLPLTPILGRVLLEAARPDRDCVLSVIDIVACLSVENIFLPTESEERREAAQDARAQLLQRQGDHLTFRAALQGFARENSDRKRWAHDRMLSHRALKAAMNVRKQLRAQCVSQKLLPKSYDAFSYDDESTGNTIDEEHQNNIIKSFLVGFKDQVAGIQPDGKYLTLVGKHPVAIHPASVLFGKKPAWILYNELVYTTKAYMRGVSAIQLSWLQEILEKSSKANATLPSNEEKGEEV